jgi:hypothetical protein
MLSVIVEAKGEGEKLAGLLAALTAAAVEGLVRDAQVVGGGPPELLAALREETGAELAQTMAEAFGRAKAELLLVAGAGFRPRPHWLEALGAHVRAGGREAVIEGEGGSLLRRAPYAVLIPKARAAALAHPDLQALRRGLARGAARLR